MPAIRPAGDVRRNAIATPIAMSIRLLAAVAGTTSERGKPWDERIAAAALNDTVSAINPEATQKITSATMITALIRYSRANHLSWMVAGRVARSASVCGVIPVAAIHTAGSPATPRRSSASAVERIGGDQP